VTVFGFTYIISHHDVIIDDKIVCDRTREHIMMSDEKTSSDLMSKKLNAIIPDETWEALEQIANEEMRTKSQMAAILLGEAISARRSKKSKSQKPEKAEE
jgi:CopG-like RHH_1 or ribbon-helix-helix domain, RHH_5